MTPPSTDQGGGKRRSGMADWSTSHPPRRGQPVAATSRGRGALIGSPKNALLGGQQPPAMGSSRRSRSPQQPSADGWSSRLRCRRRVRRPKRREREAFSWGPILSVSRSLTLPQTGGDFCDGGHITDAAGRCFGVIPSPSIASANGTQDFLKLSVMFCPEAVSSPICSGQGAYRGKNL